jgi:hypothetical protein
MDLTTRRTIRITASLLIVAAVTQAIYTGLYVAEITPPRRLLWGLEALIFSVLAAFAGAALVEAKRFALAFAAIGAAAVLNVVQVAAGLTLFGPFREVATADPTLAPVAGAVVGFSFMVYNAAKTLLGLAAVTLGRARMNAGSRMLGGAAVAVGGIAMLANTVVMIAGIDGFLPSPIAGATGVVATVLLGLCLLDALEDD